MRWTPLLALTTLMPLVLAACAVDTLGGSIGKEGSGATESYYADLPDGAAIDAATSTGTVTTTGTGTAGFPTGPDGAPAPGKPASCSSVGGAPGACLAACAPQVAGTASMLPQSTCSQGQVCAPCIDPLTMMSSGVCELTSSPTCGDGGAAVDAAPPMLSCPYNGPPVIDPSTLPSCSGPDAGAEPPDGGSGAHCLPSSQVPASEASLFTSCGSGGACVPDPIIESAGNYIPPTCSSLAGAEGRCLNTVIPMVAQQPDLPQSSCASDERCVPCFDIMTQQSTGACNTSCDPGPQQPPTTLPSCCGGLATCIPSALVPSGDSQFLTACSSDSEMCMPNELLQANFQPEPCEDDYFGITWYTGVCLSNCLVLPDASDLYQGSCDGVHTCVPCQDPDTGAPTGAPGCG